MEKQAINARTDPEEPVYAKLPYLCPSLVELDLISTDGGFEVGNDNTVDPSGLA